MPTSKFLSESKRLSQHTAYTSGNLRGLSAYVFDKMSALASEIKRLKIDATYETNKSGKG